MRTGHIELARHAEYDVRLQLSIGQGCNWALGGHHHWAIRMGMQLACAMGLQLASPFYVLSLGPCVQLRPCTVCSALLHVPSGIPTPCPVAFLLSVLNRPYVPSCSPAHVQRLVPSFCLPPRSGLTFHCTCSGVGWQQGSGRYAFDVHHIHSSSALVLSQNFTCSMRDTAAGCNTSFSGEEVIAYIGLAEGHSINWWYWFDQMVVAVYTVAWIIAAFICLKLFTFGSK